MTRKRVLIIYTGGTLGMQKTERGFRPVPNWLAEQLASLPALHTQEMPTYELIEYSPLLDSSDILPEHWANIANDIAKNYQQFDGFVVLHGTDTMAYTAAALHYLLENLSKPVIITGSQIPLSEENSDAPANIRNALYAAAYSGLQQVGLLFHRRLLAGNYATKFSAQALDGFASPNADPLLQWNDEYLQLRPIASSANNHLKVKPFSPKKVIVLTFHPGMNFELLAAWLKQPWDAVILHSFGSGNIPQNPQLLEILAWLAKQKTTLYNVSQCPHGEVQANYASGYWLAELGVISQGKLSLESSVAFAHIGE